MSYHLFYNYPISVDDANCLNFLLYDYLKASRNLKFRCKTVKEFMYFLLLSSLEENDVHQLFYEAIHYLPRLDILYECNLKIDDYSDIEFGKFINMKRILIFKIFNEFTEKEFISFVRQHDFRHENGDSDLIVFECLEYLFDKWKYNDEMEKSFKDLKEYQSTSVIPDIIGKYKRHDKTIHEHEKKIPNDMVTKDIIVTLEKGDQRGEPKFLENSESGLKTVDYNPNERYPCPEEGSIKSVCLIFNVCHYQNRERRGTEKDVDLIKETFEKLHFATHTFDDPTKAKMFEVVELYSQLESENAGSMFVCFILAHGDKDYICDINEELVSYRELSMRFSAKNCEGYRGKPKIFFIEACQGGNHQESIPHKEPEPSIYTTPLVEHDGLKKSKVKQYKEHSSVPEEADFISGMSTVPNCVSYRGVKSGTWYVQALCKAIRDNASKSHLTDILTLVTCTVSDNKYCGQYCQLPSFCSTARKKCYLTRPKNYGN